MKTFLVINGENGDPVAYYKHLGEDCIVETEVNKAAKELDITLGDGVSWEIAKYLMRGVPYWLDETWCFTMV